MGIKEDVKDIIEASQGDESDLALDVADVLVELAEELREEYASSGIVDEQYSYFEQDGCIIHAAVTLICENERGYRFTVEGQGKTISDARKRALIKAREEFE